MEIIPIFIAKIGTSRLVFRDDKELIMASDDIIHSPVLTDDEFSINEDSGNLQNVIFPLKLTHGYVCVCREGTAEIVLNMTTQVIVQHKLVILFPNEVITLSNISNDFSFLYIRLSPGFMSEILFRFPPSFIGFIKENFHFQMPAHESDLFYNEYFRVLQFRYNDVENLCRREIIANLLRNYFLDTYNKIKKNEQMLHTNRSRKNHIMEQFCELVIKNYKENRQVSFYADKLFITPKYLSMILKELDIHNRSAKEWIDDYTITEIKLKLKSSDLSILEISNEFHFPSLSFFCKYFKSRAKLTPKEYRKQIK